ncbi:acyltransferase [Cryptosporangium japonicum]|uniref:Acetyltransferase n=1 Tax=Cryptosporangium japonicum TaxID=80872 RepID=A0ABP3D1U9_9ACTN
MSGSGLPPGNVVRLFLRFLGQDIAWGLRDLLVNTIAGHLLVPRAVRYVLYRLTGMDVRTPNVYPHCRFLGDGRIRIGEQSFVNRECYFEAVGDISIGAQTAVAMQVLFVTSTHEFDADGRFSVQSSGRSIVVGDRCWLGARVTVCPGVTIGDDVVVAAGSVVTKNLAPGALYAGVPAVRIRDLPRGSRSDPPAAGSSRVPEPAVGSES